MKRFYYFLVLLPFLGCDNGNTTTGTSQRTDHLSHRDSLLTVWKTIKPTLATKYDSLTKKTTYTDSANIKLSGKSGVACWFVIIQDSTLSSLYWDVQFVEQSPLLIKKYKFFINGSSIPYKPNQMQTEYKPGLKKFYESSTNVANKTGLPILQQIAASKVAKVRFYGQFYEEGCTITDA